MAEKDENTDKIRKYLDLGNELPDLAIELENILIPLACQTFENMGIEVAKQIAREYGADVTLLHNGKRDLDRYAKPFEEFQLNVTKKIVEQSDTAEAIVEEAKNGYQLLIMPSRRRAKWIDKFFINSVSAKVIPKVDYDVLQVFPGKEDIPGKSEQIPEWTNIAILLSRAERDPRLLLWANSLVQKEEATLHAYHIADLPSITPMRVGMDTQIVLDENEEFESMIDAYQAILGTEINPRFLVSHKIAMTASNILNRDKPDIAVMGQTKGDLPWYKLRSLSDKILDNAEVPFIVHHRPE